MYLISVKCYRFLMKQELCQILSEFTSKSVAADQVDISASPCSLTCIWFQHDLSRLGHRTVALKGLTLLLQHGEWREAVRGGQWALLYKEISSCLKCKFLLILLMCLSHTTEGCLEILSPSICYKSYHFFDIQSCEIVK